MNISSYLTRFLAPGLADAQILESKGSRRIAPALAGIMLLATGAVFSGANAKETNISADTMGVLRCVANFYELHEHRITKEPIFLLAEDAHEFAALLVADEKLPSNHPLNRRLAAADEEHFGLQLRMETAQNADDAADILKISNRMIGVEREIGRLTNQMASMFSREGNSLVRDCRNLVDALDHAERRRIAAELAPEFTEPDQQANVSPSGP